MDMFEFLNQSELIIFDLDGVILESNGAKLEIMREVLRPYDVAAADQFIDEFKANFGRSRREHFLSFYETYLQRTTGFEAFFERAAARYAELLRERYLSVPLCDDAAAVIQRLSRGLKALYVVSGTLQEEAQSALVAKGLAGEFRAILGGPKKKMDNVRMVLEREGPSIRHPLLIGDAVEDGRVAAECGMRFLFAEKFSLVRAQQVIERLETNILHTVDSLREHAEVRLMVAHQPALTFG